VRKVIRTLMLVAAVGAVLAPSAVAQTPSTLSGETLEGAVTEAEPICFGGSGDFSASGTAAGPYPGTFAETGKVTPIGQGNEVSLTADFTVTSGSTTITGTKTVTGPSQAACVDELFGTFIPSASGTYQATINTPEATFTDEGTVTTEFFAGTCERVEGGFFCNTVDPPPLSGNVTQTFTSTKDDGPPDDGPPDDDEPPPPSGPEPDYNGNNREDCNDPDCFPKKGVEAGIGGPESDGSSPLPVLLGAGGLVTLLASAGGLALRRRL
jgi:hypothetical protein